MEWVIGVVLALPIIILLVGLPLVHLGFFDKPKPPVVIDYHVQRINDHRQQHYDWDLQYYQLCGQSVYAQIDKNKAALTVNDLINLSRMERDKKLAD